MPSRPNSPIEPDATSKAVREANLLVAQAVEHLRTARDLLDEASQTEGLPPGLAGGIGAKEGVIGALHASFAEGVRWIDDKAELLYSEHSPARGEPSR